MQALLLAAGAALAGFTVLRGYAPHDEGTMLAWADRIADGAWPYRDFWMGAAPGQPVLLAGLAKLLGPSLIAWRLMRVAVGAVAALLAYRLVRRDAGEGWALAAWLAVAGAMASSSEPGPMAPALALALGAQLAARRSPVRGGVLAGLAFAFQPEIGIAAALGAALEARSARPLARAVPVAAIALAPFAYVARGDMVDQVWRHGGVRGLAHLPLVAGGGAPLLERLFPLLLVAAVGGWTAWALWRRPTARRLALAPLLVAGLAVLLARADAQHALALSTVLPIALALAAARENAPARRTAATAGDGAGRPAASTGAEWSASAAASGGGAAFAGPESPAGDDARESARGAVGATFAGAESPADDAARARRAGRDGDAIAGDGARTAGAPHAAAAAREAQAPTRRARLLAALPPAARGREPSRADTTRIARLGAPAAKLALTAALALIAIHGLERRLGPLVHPPRLVAMPGAVAGGVRTTPRDARALRRVLRTVRRQARPGRPVLVAPPRFDRVRAGDPLLNVLLRRPSPTRYDAMLPGVVTTEAVQREMARELVRSRAPVVVRWIAPAARATGPSSRVHLLDHTIARRYRRVARYGDYVILLRRR